MNRIIQKMKGREVNQGTCQLANIYAWEVGREGFKKKERVFKRQGTELEEHSKKN